MVDGDRYRVDADSVSRSGAVLQFRDGDVVVAEIQDGRDVLLWCRIDDGKRAARRMPAARASWKGSKARATPRQRQYLRILAGKFKDVDPGVDPDAPNLTQEQVDAEVRRFKGEA